MELLSGPLADAAIELDVRRIELRLAWLQEAIQTLDQSGNFFPIEMAVVVIQIVEIAPSPVLAARRSVP